MKPSTTTVNRNNVDGLRRTLESTFESQPGFNDWEQIIVDGASTDGSVAILDKWKSNPHLGWHVSEPDKGLYNAMNKGAAHARGEYLLFLNSGDELLNNSLKEAFEEPFDADLVVSNMLVSRENKDHPFYPHFPVRLDPVYFLSRTLPHQGTLISRRLHEKFGGYDESLRLAADLKFFFRCFTEWTPRIAWLPKAFSRFYVDGMSFRFCNFQTIHDEWEAIIEPYFGHDTAIREGFRLEDRRWIRGVVAETAKIHHDLANSLRYTSNAVFLLWRFPPTRQVLRLGNRFASFVSRVFHRTKRHDNPPC